MRNSVMSMFSGAPAAVAVDFARDLLAMDLPQVDARGGQPVAAAVERFTVQRGIAVVPVRGILTPNSAVLERWFGWSTYFGIADALAELSGRADVSAIVLDIDSPGGTVTGCEGAAAAVSAAGAVKPVHALAAPLAASAAYWIGSQASTLAVIPGGVVGSIGVAMVAYSIVGPDNWGEQQYALTSSHARAKRPDPGTEEGMTELRRSLDEYEAVFHAAVASGRGMALDDLPARLSVTADPRDGGAVFRGQDAIARGLADTVETRSGFYARLFETYGASNRTSTRAQFRARAAAAMAATEA
ncbi:S49 family peptidase [Paracoccus aestuariivivens]|uniref:S49 family peptidase n=1 Tax=Paracoccus aestuariivivens TaxID=1820333 RepID=A0A6L6J8I7_9RHOB|nr:S49 family peptidase [Paracoccus aestuariivivens]MTH76321.1 S49 family peptidase [Paracoccus aestuariivivens]